MAHSSLPSKHVPPAGRGGIAFRCSIVCCFYWALLRLPAVRDCLLPFPFTGHRSPELPDCPVLLSFGIFQRFRPQPDLGFLRHVALVVGSASLPDRTEEITAVKTLGCESS